jgi:hypothetical protein
MIEISEQITRVTTSSDPITPPRPNIARAPTGARVTLEFSRSVPLSPGQQVRVRYDFAGDGHFLDCVGVPQHTYFVARRGHLDVFHYRLSHWIAPAALSRIRAMPA